ncbi:hypothetical protein [Bradyrhizobium sp. JYMT SZCCT0428]|uniref:hypothetical protein n=1 Tax=Bradyrhizobium sp. JYMT SZCCT0428 TaxID=2807673 RepID=UPI001BA77627|nr:hypothetical protein [Bradyrhizobium sp. JYMT SZCCT0428]MBR1155243.1 hypothetical protein [Bradyrhizobium sp. JYMT SZCCT0428]
MAPSQAELAVKVLSLLKSAKLARDDKALQQAADLTKLVAPAKLSELTPRFEAYFAIATLVTALRYREDSNTLDRRFAHAVSLSTMWVQLQS